MNMKNLIDFYINILFLCVYHIQQFHFYHIISGSRSLQCTSDGKCQCKPGVTGEKCDSCALNYFQFTNQGCKPCLCNEAGSYNNAAYCDPNTGVCMCKQNVEGKQCRQ